MIGLKLILWISLARGLPLKTKLILSSLHKKQKMTLTGLTYTLIGYRIRLAGELKMTKILFLFAILWVASAGCVELENICSFDTFRFNNLLVNSFHRVQRYVAFQPLSHYLINDTIKCDFFEFKNKTNFWEALRLKNE